VRLVAGPATRPIDRDRRGQGVAALLHGLLLLRLLFLEERIVALAQLGRAFVDLGQISFDPHILVHVLVFLLAQTKH